MKSQSGRKVKKLSFGSLRSREWADDFRRDPGHLESSLTPVEASMEQEGQSTFAALGQIAVSVES